MDINKYFNDLGGELSFTRQQGSDFAKQIAGDFNPLHNTDAKRFCVPGDLLFSVILARYGCFKQMKFTFSGMVTEDIKLIAPEGSMISSLKDINEKEYLSVEHSGDCSQNPTLINNLIESYVSFSGKTFPYILVPLMEKEKMMINPARPMVMYQSMLIDLESFQNEDVSLQLDKSNTRFEVNGKRGKISLAFNLMNGDKKIGRGEKHMVVSGLKPYDKSSVDNLITEYESWKNSYFNRS